jgi:hypothetical protein
VIKRMRNYSFGTVIPLVLLHVACIAVVFIPFRWSWVELMVAMYAVPIFGVTAGYHRYFSHRSHEYDWTFTPPGERLISQSVNYEDGREIFDATLKLERLEWSRAELHSALLRFPWMTAKVITAIHWQALRLLRKRVPVVSHPGAGHFERATVQHLGASWPVE